MRVIGMISGTSFDAVEALLANLELDGEHLVVDLVAHRSVPYLDEISTGIARVLPPARIRHFVQHLAHWRRAVPVPNPGYCTWGYPVPLRVLERWADEVLCV